MGQHEYWRVERRLVAPPAAPVVVVPGAALRAEFVAAHDLGADVAGVVSREVIVEAAASAGVCAHGPARRGASPGEHVGRVGVAERPLDALVFTGTESITRDVEVLDSQQLIHAVPSALLMMVRLREPDSLIGGTGQS